MHLKNHRDADNLHFQGKALALLDWQWNKVQAERAARGGKLSEQQLNGLLELRRSLGEHSENEQDGVSADSILVSVSDTDPHDHASLASPEASAGNVSLVALTKTPMGAALHQYFVRERRDSLVKDGQTIDGLTIDEREVDTGGPSTSNINMSLDAGAAKDGISLPSEIERDAPSESRVPIKQTASPSAGVLSPRAVEPVFDGEKIVEQACRTASGRAMFVKCLNQQRSLETQIKDRVSFDTLVNCFNVFLDECIREDDVKAAKTAMILAETFYLPKDVRNAGGTDEGQVPDPPQPPDQNARVDGEESANEALLHSLENAHPLLHPGVMGGRGATRVYLQEEVKQHAIWKNPSVCDFAACDIQVMPRGVTDSLSFMCMFVSFGRRLSYSLSAKSSFVTRSSVRGKSCRAVPQSTTVRFVSSPLQRVDHCSISLTEPPRSANARGGRRSRAQHRVRSARIVHAQYARVRGVGEPHRVVRRDHVRRARADRGSPFPAAQESAGDL